MELVLERDSYKERLTEAETQTSNAPSPEAMDRLKTGLADAERDRDRFREKVGRPRGDRRRDPRRHADLAPRPHERRRDAQAASRRPSASARRPSASATSSRSASTPSRRTSTPRRRRPRSPTSGLPGLRHRDAQRRPQLRPHGRLPAVRRRLHGQARPRHGRRPGARGHEAGRQGQLLRHASSAASRSSSAPRPVSRARRRSVSRRASAGGIKLAWRAGQIPAPTPSTSVDYRGQEHDPPGRRRRRPERQRPERPGEQHAIATPARRRSPTPAIAIASSEELEEHGLPRRPERELEADLAAPLATR